MWPRHVQDDVVEFQAAAAGEADDCKIALSVRRRLLLHVSKDRRQLAAPACYELGGYQTSYFSLRVGEAADLASIKELIHVSLVFCTSLAVSEAVDLAQKPFGMAAAVADLDQQEAVDVVFLENRFVAAAE